jgi:hypothetical protein
MTGNVNRDLYLTSHVGREIRLVASGSYDKEYSNKQMHIIVIWILTYERVPNKLQTASDSEVYMVVCTSWMNIWLCNYKQISRLS